MAKWGFESWRMSWSTPRSANGENVKVAVGGNVADFVREIWEKDEMGDEVDDRGLVVRRNCVNAGEWMLGVAVIGMRISINWRGLRGIRFVWVKYIVW